MLAPYLALSTSGLRRSGPFGWQAVDGDPHFKFPFRLGRPRYLVLVLDGIDRRVEPTVFLDRGQGFTDEASASFRSTGRFVCRLDLWQMPEVARVRLDPMSEPGRVRLVAWASATRLGTNLLVKRLVRSRVASGPTRVFTIRESGLEHTNFGSGLERRGYRSAAEHYAEVLAMPRPPGGCDDLAGRSEPLLTLLVPTFETPPAYLDALLASVRAQPDGSVALIFGDDGSTAPETLAWLDRAATLPGVSVVRGAARGGIAAATNAALALATTPWVTMLDHDDALSPGAVPMIAGALAMRPDAEFLFTDEVVADAGLGPRDYLLKPGYDPVLLSGVNYLNHLSVYRTERLRSVGGLRDGFQGSQDYDLLLRYLRDVPAERVLHLPYPAYLWRRHETSFSTAHVDTAVANARKALGERYGEPPGSVPVEAALSPGLHRVRFDKVRRDWPSVSVIVPSRDGHDLLARLLAGLAERTEYPDFEVVVVDNGSTDPAVFALYEQYRSGPLRFRAEVVPEPFNFSRSVNRGIRLARGEHVLLLNNDIEIVEPDWLSEMVSCLAYEGAGVVGARLLYPDGTLQHAGVIIGAGGLAGHWFERSPADHPGPLGRLGVRQTMSAVTGAAMLIARPCLDAVGPWDEERFAIAYNDIDYCLRARELGFRTVWTPFATLIHHESASRGSDRTAANLDRFRQEQRHLRERHGTTEFSDPATSPWHTRDHAVPALRPLDELPPAR